ncbi:MAG TPA: tripartite tricarboxylate transporter substrate-binding protein, partial [Burkholderiales bacterium]|nr:tripartite tricarboxylate transporter substrate-binding protein [Burkholderiales bacterium]
LMPELPTIAESGFPGYDVSGWDGVLAPAGTPRVIIVRLHHEFVAALQIPDTREFFNRVGYEVTGTTPEELAQIIRKETAMWEKVIKSSGIRVE